MTARFLHEQPLSTIDEPGSEPAVLSRLVPNDTLIAVSGSVANAAAVATLPAVVGKTNYITGFQCTALGATSLANVEVTIAGLQGGTLTYMFQFPAGVTLLAQALNVQFSRPLKASGQNVAIVATLPAGGAGNTKANMNVQGFVV